VNTDRQEARQTESKLQRCLQAISVFEDGLLVLMLCAMIIMACLQIILRNFFDTGFSWADPMLRMMVLWIGLIGAMVATRQDNHISIDILTRYMSQRARTMKQLLTDLFAGVVCGVLAYHSMRFLLQDYQANVMAFADVPAWIFEIIMPVGFTVMCLRYLLRLVSGIRVLVI
jgi:TRAP-type C4-dicarboxylate transport system permease small subunit